MVLPALKELFLAMNSTTEGGALGTSTIKMQKLYKVETIHNMIMIFYRSYIHYFVFQIQQKFKLASNTKKDQNQDLIEFFLFLFQGIENESDVVQGFIQENFHHTQTRVIECKWENDSCIEKTCNIRYLLEICILIGIFS